MTPEDVETEIVSLKARIVGLEVDIRRANARIDVIWTPFWKRIWFLVDGWPWYSLADHPAPRPWR